MFKADILRCEFAENPLGIGTRSPRLSWQVKGQDPKRRPTDFQILVASSPERLRADDGDLWDTGRRPVGTAPLIDYAGEPLESRQRAWWKVRIWDDQGQAGSFSEAHWFELGLLHPSEWSAAWIGHRGSAAAGALYLRLPFALDHQPVKARLYAAGLGLYEMYLNGEKVGHQVLEPAATDTSRRVLYATHDVTDHLHQGDNIIGAVLGHGWTGGQKLLAQLEITLSSGEVICVKTGHFVDAPPWMAFHGPIVEESLFDGEVYDSRLENPDWCLPMAEDFNAPPMRELFHAMVVDAPGGALEAQPMESIEVVGTLPVVAISRLDSGAYVVDTGQNLAGWLQLQADGPSGHEITLRYSESLYPDGSVNQENLRSARARDVFILNGTGLQTWEPTFTYHGFRYVQIDGYPGDLTSEAVSVRVAHSALTPRTTFSTDVDQINRLQRAVVWTEKSNVHGVPTDCPQRNERMGWLNDLAARTEELMYTFDVSRFLSKWVQDIADTQDEAGAISDTAPYRFGARPADPVSVCYALIPWLLITHHADLRTAERHYEGIRDWFDFLTSSSEDGILEYSHYGDWAPPATVSLKMDDGVSARSAHTPGALISTAHYYYLAVLLQRISAALGMEEESEELAVEADTIRAAFNREFYHGPGIGYGSGNQAANATAVYLGLVPEELVEGTVALLAEDIRRHDHHLTTGNLATKYALEVLAEHGHVDVALDVVLQTSYPSWGFMLANGATTIWERWESETGGGMNSHNHPMYGSVGAWFYRRLAGIVIPDDAVGVSRVSIQPLFDQRLQWVQGVLKSMRGELRCEWRRNGNQITVTAEVPFGMEASLHLPQGVHVQCVNGITARLAAGHPLALASGVSTEVILETSSLS